MHWYIHFSALLMCFFQRLLRCRLGTYLISCCYVAVSESMPLSDLVVVQDQGVFIPSCTQMRQLLTYADPQSEFYQSYDWVVILSLLLMRGSVVLLKKSYSALMSLRAVD